MSENNCTFAVNKYRISIAKVGNKKDIDTYERGLCRALCLYRCIDSLSRYEARCGGGSD